MGTKVFDKSMMTYQYGQGQSYTIPIYCWYLEGDGPKILVDTGEINPIPLHEPRFAAVDTIG
jgi:N-acyl homoserine lactone hydrolase